MRVALGLGSNVGDRRAHLESALHGLRARMEVLKVSRFVATEPQGGPPQGGFLNAAALVETGLRPRELLDLAHELEEAAGRQRGERWGPRTLDIDLLLYGDEIVDESDLVIPHPRLHERRFVLDPLAEIAPDWIVPRLNRTVGELRENLHHRC
ncbi:MAG: 2-amino-4-hydroxy-6-hydroxymethyldihydropteridine diphosphokinase [Planctomycetota bacterium]|jgi:2-amino-4-hydroxy-6-hydroxymethyldihydropteridine diphosphokinase